MLAKVPQRYLLRRGNVFHYRRRVPDDVWSIVGKKWWKLTLKTSFNREAEMAARQLAVQHDLLIAKLRGLPLAEKRAAYLEAITFAKDDLYQGIDVETNSTIVESAAAAASVLQKAMVVAAKKRLSQLTAEEIADIETCGGIQAYLEAIERQAEDVARQQSTLSVDEVLGKFTHREVETRSSTLQTQSRFVAKDRHTLQKLGLLAQDARNDDPTNPRITIAMEQWFRDRGQGLSATKRHRVAVQRFVELHGDVTVGQITQGMVRAFVDAITNLADHRRLPANMRGGLADPNADLPRVSAKTVERHLTSIKALLTFCITKEWLAHNVASGLVPPKDNRKKGEKRRPFTREERSKLYAQAIEEYGADGEMTWLIVLAAYTGARLEELAQLARSNVRTIDGIRLIEIDDLDDRNVKNRSSVRTIPLHPAIADAFMSWVAAGQGARVFPTFRPDKNGRYANQLSGDIARLMDRAELTDKRLVFHSFRHTLKREMSDARIDPDIRRAVLGHAGKDAHDGYAGHSMKVISEAFAELPRLFD